MGVRSWWLRLRGLVAREQVERELDEEVRFHLDMETQTNIRRGMSPEEARREAHRKFGGVERHKEAAREARGTRPLEDLVRDVRMSMRGLARSPGFAAAVLCTLALGIGGTTSVFSVVRGVLLRPLPFPEAHELTTIWLANDREGIEEDVTSWPNFQDWRSQTDAFQEMVAVSGGRFTVTQEGPAEEVRGAFVTDGFFDMLGSTMHLGRGFRAEEARDGAAPVVVLSHELWVRRFGAAPSIVGTNVILSDRPYTVVGVTQPGHRHPHDAELWTPLTFDDGMQGLRESRGALWLPIMGRLAEGVTLEEAQAQMDGIARRLAGEYEVNEGMGVNLEPLHETLVGDVRTPLMILFGAVVFVLLVGSANVANLLLARGAVRAREMAVRLSLGAGRARLIRQVVTESAVLGLLGGLLGVGLAAAAVSGLERLVPLELPRLDAVGLDGGVLLFALGLSLGAGLLFAVLPALQVAGADPGEHLKEGARGASSGGLGRLRPLFVVGQFAFAVVLLVGAGLLTRSFFNVMAVDAGYDPEGVLTAEVRLPDPRYPDSESVRAFYATLVPRLQSLPGVEHAGVITAVLLDRLPNMGRIALEGRPDLEEVLSRHSVTRDAATADALRALGIELITGRLFNSTDGPGAAMVAVVNETFVRRFLPEAGVDGALGQRFVFGDGTEEDPGWITIVGIVEDAKRSGLTEEVRPAAFLPWTTVPAQVGQLVLRTGARDANALHLVEGLRAALQEADPTLPLTRIRTLEQAVSATMAQRRFLTVLLAAFALAGTLLAAVGIYGVMAYLVGHRTRELGIRAALGAHRGDIISGVLREALTQAGAGLVLGVAGAMVLSGLLRTQLFGLEPADPLTFTGVAVTLLGVAMLASWIPARRAASVDPAVALRGE